MEGDTPQVPATQEQTEVKSTSQAPQQPPAGSQATSESPPPTKPKKWLKTKILIILIILIGLGMGGFFVWKNISVPEVEKEVVPAPSGEVKVYKGIWTPTLLAEDSNKLTSKMQKLKDIGVNTIFFQGFPPQSECLERLKRPKGGLPPAVLEKIKEIFPIEKELMIANIQTAHRNGLRVGLTMGKCTFSKPEEIDLEAWNSKIIEYAKLAEKYEVEFFAPMNEPEVMFGPSASATWGQEILPKIKEVYHGKVVWKGSAIGDIQPDQPTNFSGYDYFGFTISRGLGRTLEEFSLDVDYALNTFLGLAERDNLKGVMITEFYGTSLRESAWNEELDARAHEIVLEKGRGKVVGFFALDFLELSFLGGEIPGMPVAEKTLKTKEVIRKWFTEIL